MGWRPMVEGHVVVRSVTEMVCFFRYESFVIRVLLFDVKVFLEPFHCFSHLTNFNISRFHFFKFDCFSIICSIDIVRHYLKLSEPKIHDKVIITKNVSSKTFFVKNVITAGTLLYMNE